MRVSVCVRIHARTVSVYFYVHVYVAGHKHIFVYSVFQLHACTIHVELQPAESATEKPVACTLGRANGTSFGESASSKRSTCGQARPARGITVEEEHWPLLVQQDPVG